MSNEQAPPIADFFKRLYREVSMSVDRESMQRRWDGVLALLKSIEAQDIEAALCIVFKTKQLPAKEALDRIRLPFKTADDLFEMSGNDRELEILCLSVLSLLCREDATLGPLAAIAVSTTAINGARSQQLSMDIISEAEQALTTWSEQSRSRPDITKLLSKSFLKVDFAKSLEALEASADINGIKEAFKHAAASAQRSLQSVMQQTGALIDATNRFITIQDEELQMLWWNTSKESLDMGCAFANVPANAQPLVFSKELAELTVTLPGPSSVKGLLALAGLDTQENLTIPDVVNACPTEWLAGLVDSHAPSPIMHPIHFAVQRKIETGDDTAWVTPWGAVVAIDPAYKFSGLSIGNLFYRERLQLLFK